MSFLDAVWQGILQGLTEFLPVSSSGHLAVYQELFTESGSSTFMTVMLHFGTLVAVFIAFRKTIWALIKEFFVMVGDLFKGKKIFQNMGPERRMICMLVLSLCPLLVIYPLIKLTPLDDLLDHPPLIMVGICFLITSAVLFFSDRCTKENVNKGNTLPRQAFFVGGMQCIALLPGVSRSGSTVCGGLFCGFNREYAVEYSFILGIPAVLGAFLSELLDVLTGEAGVLVTHEIPAILLGMVISAVVGLGAIWMVKWLVRTRKFKIFALYTLILGILVCALCIATSLSGAESVRALLGLAG